MDPRAFANMDAPPVRPMTAADYGEGHDVTPPGGGDRRSVRELAVGAVIAAAALWAVPRVLDYVAEKIAGDVAEDEPGEDDFEDLEFER